MTAENYTDRKKINSGAAVQKRIEVYHISNFTCYLSGREFLAGDETQSGQVVILNFKK